MSHCMLLMIVHRLCACKCACLARSAFSERGDRRGQRSICLVLKIGFFRPKPSGIIEECNFCVFACDDLQQEALKLLGKQGSCRTFPLSSARRSVCQQQARLPFSARKPLKVIAKLCPLLVCPRRPRDASETYKSTSFRIFDVRESGLLPRNLSKPQPDFYQPSEL